MQAFWVVQFWMLQFLSRFLLNIPKRTSRRWQSSIRIFSFRLKPIIQNFLVWLPSQCFNKSGFYLEPRVSSWPTHLVFPHLMHSTPHHLRHRLGKTTIYKSEEYSALILSTDCLFVKTWGWIILGCHLVVRSNQLVRRNKTSNLVQLSALLSQSRCDE